MKNSIVQIGAAVSLVFTMVFALTGCGSGGSGAGGNSISGVLKADSSTARLIRQVADTPYAYALVELVDSSGNIIASTFTDGAGLFQFTGVMQGDYTLVFYDPATRMPMSRVTFSLINGDNASLNGTVTTGGVNYTLDFVPNTSYDQETLDRAALLASLSGRTIEEILAMRDSGMGWGKIARSLGVHPGELGFGHKDGFDHDKKDHGKDSDKGKDADNDHDSGNDSADDGDLDKPDKPEKAENTERPDKGDNVKN